MNKIKILPIQEAQKIAAGEVVERPSSVVKELIENSIDAKATQISLYIQKSGKQLIRVVDDGSGMSASDAKTCFLPHATSKISKMDDLEQIATFGFRGEALATISAVSRVQISTKNRDEQESENLGIFLEYKDGNVIKEEPTSCSYGTDLKIYDLFFNTPVRKKFLKQDETEWNQIQYIFYCFCLSNLSIHFKLYRDDKLILNAPAVNDLKDRVCQIWGHNFTQNLVELEKPQNTEVKIYGLISNHNFWRYGRELIHFFVNGRNVKNKELSKALLKGYLNVLPPQKFPATFVFINLPNFLVDINVHPRKEEVKFAKPLTIENLLQESVKQSLQKKLTKQLQPNKIEQETKRNNFYDPVSRPVNFTEKFEPSKVFVPNDLNFNFENFGDFKKNETVFKPDSAKIEQEYTQEFIYQDKESNIDLDVKIIGQLFRTYILLENQDGFVMIDQHAAHERILYEKFLKNFEKKDGVRLLFPEVLTVEKYQIDLLMPYKEFFTNQGIEIEEFGNNQIAIKTSPPGICNQSLKEFVLETVAFIEENENLEQEVFRKKLNEHVHSQMACKAAVKAGDVLTNTQMHELINDLNKTENRLICVHGRPTTWILNKYQIEKNFKRK